MGKIDAGEARSAAQQPSFSDARIRVGDRVQVELPSSMGLGRLPAVVIGWAEGKSLILSTPVSEGSPVPLREGEILLVRAFTGRKAIAFRSAVIKTSVTPYPHIHLTFPDRIHALDVRAASRHRVDFTVAVTITGSPEPIVGSIRDISATGALIETEAHLGDPGAHLHLDFTFALHEIPVSLKIVAEILSVSEKGAEPDRVLHHHGVAFCDVAPNDALMLRALSLYEMHERPARAH